MTRRGVWVSIVGVVVIAAGAWVLARSRGMAGLHPADGQLAVAWTGPHAGHVALPATVRWCPVTRVGVLEAISGDTGVMVAIHERDSLASGVHPIVAGTAAPTVTPSATAAMRWVRAADDTVLAMFQSTGGSLDLQVNGASASGSFSAPMRSTAGGAPVTITVRGAFRGLSVSTTAAGCT